MKNPSLSLVVLRCEDIHEERAFYEAIGLGFREEQHGNGPVHYSCDVDGVLIELYPGKHGTAPQRSQAGASTLGFSVYNLEETLAALNEIGAKVVSSAKETEWGKRALVLDPAGRAVDLTEPLRPPRKP